MAAGQLPKGNRKMKMLVIGGAGFAGSNVAFHLLNKGHDVIVFDNLVRRGGEMNLDPFRKAGIEFVHGDIRNPEDLAQLKGKCDIIFLTAAQPSVWFGYENPVFDITNNYTGMLNVLEFARKKKSAMIFWSTNKVYTATKINAIETEETKTRYSFKYVTLGIAEDFPIDGDDHGIYGLSKVCADLTCQEWSNAFDLPVVVNRFSCLAGPGQFGKTEQGWCAWFVIAAMLELPVTIFGFKGKQVRDILFVPDMLTLIDKQIEQINHLHGEVFNIGGGQGCNASLLEFITKVEYLTGKRIEYVYDPVEHKADHRVYISDTRKAKQLLGWEPKIGLQAGIADLVDWVQKNRVFLESLYRKAKK